MPWTADTLSRVSLYQHRAGVKNTTARLYAGPVGGCEATEILDEQAPLRTDAVFFTVPIEIAVRLKKKNPVTRELLGKGV